MLLAVDVGNTNVTLALFDGERLAADWRLTSRREWTADELAGELRRRVEPVAPDSVIGRNTVASIQSGLVWGFVAQVEGMVKRMVDELGGQARVVATGGQASLVAGLTHVIETTDPLLTLEGLRLIYAQNSDGGAR